MSSNSSSTASQLAGNIRQRYAYRFMSMVDGQRYLYISDFGKGASSQAQLVRNMQTKEVVVRKVLMVLARRTVDRALPFRPIKPREIVMFDVIKKLPVIPGVPHYIATYHSFEYVKAAFSTTYNADLYRLASYWPVYNGGPVADMSGLGNTFKVAANFPMAAIGRMIWQVYGSLDHLTRAGPDPILHFDLHFGNIMVHWSDTPTDLANPGSLLPDFVIIDFGEAYFYSEVTASPFDSRPELADIKRMHTNVELILEELGVLVRTKPKGFQGSPSEIPIQLTEGPHGPAIVKLFETFQTIKGIVANYVAKYPSHPELLDLPSLMEVVRLGKELEAMCLPGGEADETATQLFQRFVTEDRKKALALSRANPFTMRGTKEEAMTPVDAKTGQPIELYGPWTLCANVWKSAQEAPAPRPDPRLVGRIGKLDQVKGGEGTETALVMALNGMPEIEEDHAKPGRAPGQKTRNGRAPKSLLDINLMLGPISVPKPARGFDPLLREIGMSSGKMAGGFLKSNLGSSIAESGSDPCSSSSPETDQDTMQFKQLESFMDVEHPVPASRQTLKPTAMSFQPTAMSFQPTAPSFQPTAPSFQPTAPSFQPTALAFQPAASSSFIAPAPPPAPSPPPSNLGNLHQILTDAVSAHGDLVSQTITDLGDLNQQMQQGPLADIQNALANLDLEMKRVNQAEKRQKQLHAIVHGDKCDCDSWFEEIVDRIEMDGVFNDAPRRTETLSPLPVVVEEEPEAETLRDKGKQREGEPSKMPVPSPSPAPAPAPQILVRASSPAPQTPSRRSEATSRSSTLTTTMARRNRPASRSRLPVRSSIRTTIYNMFSPTSPRFPRTPSFRTPEPSNKEGERPAAAEESSARPQPSQRRKLSKTKKSVVKQV